MIAYDDYIRAEVNKKDFKNRVDVFNYFFEMFGIEEFYITEIAERWLVEIKIKYLKGV